MTEDTHTTGEDGDPRLIEELARLRAIEPSAAAFSRLHRLVEAELSEIRTAESTVWWRRSVRVPLPVCIAAGLALIALLFWKAPSAADRPTDVPAATATDVPATAAAVVSTKPESVLRTTSTYMLGVGELSTEAHYFASEGQL